MNNDPEFFKSTTKLRSLISKVESHVRRFKIFCPKQNIMNLKLKNFGQKFYILR